MGDDGSRGAALVKARGGTVLVERVETALIAGMPSAAVAAGGVDAQLSIDRIADALSALTEPSGS
jgi:two-component system chemotaxis response regulator CheB